MMDAPAANPSRPSVRFTPLVAAVMIKFDQSMKKIAPSYCAAESEVQPRDVADQGDLGRCGAQAVLVGELKDQHSEDDAHGGLEDQLGACVEAKAAFVGDLDEVIKEANKTHTHHEEEQQEPGCRGPGEADSSST